MTPDAANPRVARIGPPVERAGAVQPIHPAVVVDDRLVFVSGQVPMRAGRPVCDDVAGQTHATIDLLEEILRRAGCSLADVAKVTVWLAHADDYPAFHRAWGERFAIASAPARSTVVSGLLAPVRVEMEAIAVRPPAAR